MAQETLSLATARRWIGCRLILKDDYREFKAGTRCIVGCVVDYGDEDGLLLWVDTNDDRYHALALEVDQFDFVTFKRLFRTITPVQSRPPASPLTARNWSSAN